MMTATRTHRAPRPGLVVAAFAAILIFLVATPSQSAAQGIGDQTGYQEFTPPDGVEGSAEDGSAGGGGAGFSSGGGSASGGDSGVSGGSGGATSGAEGSGGGSSGEGTSAAANGSDGSSTGGVAAAQNAGATGEIPLTSENLLLALAVAAVAIGVGVGVNRLARRNAGT